MGRQQDRQAASLPQLEEVGPDPTKGGLVETGRGFVEDQKLRFVNQRPNELDPTAHASGQTRDRFVASIGKGDPFEEILDSPRCVAPADTVQTRREGQILSCGQPGIESRLLKDHAAARPKLSITRANGLPVQLEATLGRIEQTANHLEQGGLAGPVSPEQADHLATAKIEAHTSQYRSSRAVDGQITDGQ
jgi:hypothetical protein